MSPWSFYKWGIDIVGPFPEGPGKARLDERSKDWIEEIPHVLWAHRTIIKSSNRDTPFLLTYRTEAVIPAEIGMPTLRTAEIDIMQNNEVLKINLDFWKKEGSKQQSEKKEARQRCKNITTPKSATQASSQETLCTGTMMSTMQEIAESLTLSKRRFQPERLAQGLEVGSIRRIQWVGYGVLEFLGVGTTFDIFQNIHILYLQYGVLTSSGYGVLSFIPLWSLVSAGTDTPYLP
ncbi:reverse transcriptase domain-containing protein [Tanacetum coccineum]|uniref:Reverse transcriptase domain-containing protein n=1 Tax=Tanacetum coccineum TaxID=301880 RepID=A0ABQ4XE90_9ASTR